ncbi:polyadenylate-specific 3'-exoribonuclease AS [Corynebacterium massiliense]|uniref:3'-5' exoribonuclease n=1 Tax=Corynebacterium massiliense DSM 45435 TaxID=1121364 RepID=A0ABY7UAU2_9CORY|nr:polyadenylate-specific 3'-exoribonuclease AS [Corynebacterium massiliense]WCZ32863.1 3'-5' exoribonuclease.1 [Corynebacterium massiliense DSM 45435]
MRYFYDTEFIEDGRTIELVSVGVVAEDGREYYAVSTDFDASRANAWVRGNVLAKLPSAANPVWKPRDTIRQELFAFLTADGERPELWAWVGGYDHVVIAQLWGDMSELPPQMPRFTRELKQYWEFAGKPQLPKTPSGNHDALVDARHNLAKFRACEKKAPLNKANRTLNS